MAVAEEDSRNSSQACRGSNRPDQQQRLAAEFIDHGHRDHGESQIGGSDGDGLKVAGDSAESGMSKDVVEIIKDGVDARQLIEHTDAHRQNDGESIFSGKQFFRRLPLFHVDGFDDFLQIALVVIVPRHLQNVPGLGHTSFFDQPSRTARNRKQHHKK